MLHPEPLDQAEADEVADMRATVERRRTWADLQYILDDIIAVGGTVAVVALFVFLIVH